MIKIIPLIISLLEQTKREFVHLRKIYALLLLFLTAIPFLAFAQQQHKIIGTVLDGDTNQPIVGVNVILVNNNAGTITDNSGSFSIETRSFPVTFKISFLGYKTTELEIYEYTEPVTIFLNEDFNLQNEIVVIGYGTQKRKELTGSVASVSKAALLQTTSSFDNILGGAVPGVNVTQSSGQPGASTTIRIRGSNSITGGNEPLYVIDGFIAYNDNNNAQTGTLSSGSRVGADASLNLLSTINPADIESIEVLKDASATAIYGTRGANGVVIITTKKGEKGKNRVSYQGTFGWQQISKKLDLLNGKQWAERYNDVLINTYQDEYIAYQERLITDPTAQAPASPSYIDPNNVANSDWQSAALRTGSTQDHQVAITGGDEITRYAISGNYFTQEGILHNTGFDRFSARVNLDRNINKKFRVGINIIGSHSVQDGLSSLSNDNMANTWVSILRASPAVAIYDANGNYNYNNPYSTESALSNGGQANPLADLKSITSETKVNRTLGNFFAEYEIINGLKAKLNAGADLLNAKQNYYAPTTTTAGARGNGYASVGSKVVNSWQSEFTLNYDKRLNDNHTINVFAGYTLQRSDVESSQAIATNFVNDKLIFNSLQDASTAALPYSDAATNILASYIGRINYSFLDRYHLTGTIRSDGSSRFAENHKWALFPSLGLSWNINEENFLLDFRTISNLKLRLSAGTTGNQEIGDYQYESRLATQNYSFDGKLVTGFYPVNQPNPDLRWEKTTQYNAGIDFGLWSDRLTLNLDVYSKKTTDLLFEIPEQTASGYSYTLKNVGSVTNKGVEVGLSADIVKNRTFTWTSNLNWSKNKNRVADLGGSFENDQFVPTFPSAGALVTAAPGIVKVGYSIGTFYGYEFDGIVQEGDDLSKVPNPSWIKSSAGVQPGDAKFVDHYEDGVIDEKDKVVLGSVEPDFIFGFNNNFAYKNFDLSLFIQGSYGNQIYNALRNRLELNYGLTYNSTTSALDRWTPTNTVTDIPRSTNASTFNMDNRFVEDASYVKLKNITLGYTLPLRKITQSRAFRNSGLRVFVSAQNLFTITNYSGFDPESSRNGGNEQSNLLQGIDYGAYPSSKGFSFGVGLNL